VVCLDACISSSLCIAQFIAKGKNMGRVFFELLQSIFEEGRVPTTLPDSVTCDIFAADTIDFVLWEDFLQAKGADRNVQNLAVIA
jgi:hypothetical protein